MKRAAGHMPLVVLLQFERASVYRFSPNAAR